MIFQNPGASLNPVFRVGEQMLEAMALHLPEGRADAEGARGRDLGRVGISSPRTRARDYPHQFSGGMAQRVMIGMGISCAPSLLIADEPTTALDVTIQAQVLALIRRLARELGVAVLLVSHDLGIISQMCHRVLVMYAGRVVEEALGARRSSARPPTRTRAGSSSACPGSTATAGSAPSRGMMPGLRALPPGCRFHPAVPSPSRAARRGARRSGPSRPARRPPATSRRCRDRMPRLCSRSGSRQALPDPRQSPGRAAGRAPRRASSTRWTG